MKNLRRLIFLNSLREWDQIEKIPYEIKPPIILNRIKNSTHLSFLHLSFSSCSSGASHSKDSKSNTEKIKLIIYHDLLYIIAKY